jgi:hypothetical protein
MSNWSELCQNAVGSLARPTRTNVVAYVERHARAKCSQIERFLDHVVERGLFKFSTKTGEQRLVFGSKSIKQAWVKQTKAKEEQEQAQQQQQVEEKRRGGMRKSGGKKAQAVLEDQEGDEETEEDEFEDVFVEEGHEEEGDRSSKVAVQKKNAKSRSVSTKAGNNKKTKANSTSATLNWNDFQRLHKGTTDNAGLAEKWQEYRAGFEEDDKKAPTILSDPDMAENIARAISELNDENGTSTYILLNYLSNHTYEEGTDTYQLNIEMKSTLQEGKALGYFTCHNKHRFKVTRKYLAKLGLASTSPAGRGRDQQRARSSGSGSSSASATALKYSRTPARTRSIKPLSSASKSASKKSAAKSAAAAGRAAGRSRSPPPTGPTGEMLRWNDFQRLYRGEGHSNLGLAEAWQEYTARFEKEKEPLKEPLKPNRKRGHDESEESGDDGGRGKGRRGGGASSKSTPKQVQSVQNVSDRSSEPASKRRKTSAKKTSAKKAGAKQTSKQTSAEQPSTEQPSTEQPNDRKREPRSSRSRAAALAPSAAGGKSARRSRRAKGLPPSAPKGVKETLRRAAAARVESGLNKGGQARVVKRKQPPQGGRRRELGNTFKPGATPVAVRTRGGKAGGTKGKGRATAKVVKTVKRSAMKQAGGRGKKQDTAAATTAAPSRVPASRRGGSGRARAPPNAFVAGPASSRPSR